jgi:hypothetical protein
MLQPAAGARAEVPWVFVRHSHDSCTSESCTAPGDDSCDCEGPKTLFAQLGWEEPAEESGEEDTIETDRPDFTEASSTVGRGRVQLEMGYTYFRDREGDVAVDAHSFPETLLRVGVLAEWFELRLAWNYASERTRTGGLSTTISEPEDLYVGAKFALTEQHGLWPEMALMPQMTLPTAPRSPEGFGSGEVMPGVNWLYGWDINDFLSLGGSTQGNRALDETGEFYTEFAQSLTIGYGLTDKLGAYTEWFGFFPHGAAEAKPEYYFNGGFTYLVTNDVQLDIRAGLGLNDHADDFFAGTGLSVRW